MSVTDIVITMSKMYILLLSHKIINDTDEIRYIMKSERLQDLQEYLISGETDKDKAREYYEDSLCVLKNGEKSMFVCTYSTFSGVSNLGTGYLILKV